MYNHDIIITDSDIKTNVSKYLAQKTPKWNKTDWKSMHSDTLELEGGSEQDSWMRSMIYKN
jgi:hypothetical protein